MSLNKKLPFSLIEISFYFFPLSLILGSLIVNINLIIFLFLSFYFFMHKKIKIVLSRPSIFLLLFFVTIIISSILNVKTIEISNLIKSILLLKFFLLYLSLETLIKNDKINLDYFFVVCIILVSLVSLDLIIQFFYGKNILGYKPWEGRITGVFEHEAIAGAYLQKLFLFSLIGSLLIFKKNNKKNFFSSLFLIMIIIFGSFVASNRISFFILIASSLILIIFFSKFRKKLIIAFIFLTPIFTYLYQTNEQTNIKYESFINKVGKFVNFNKVSNETENLTSEVSSGHRILPNHGKIFLTAFKSFDDNKIIGNGLKSFRFECKKYLLEKNTICSTHPHNYHLEVLHDTGLIGFMFITIFVILILIEKIKLILQNKILNIDKLVLVLILLNFMIELFPIKSTGSLFTTWNGSLVWIAAALINYKYHEIDSKKIF